MEARRPTAEFTELLRGTSRSFYLTLRMLPRGVRWQIGLAYLLARCTDTIADTEAIAVERRVDALKQLREAILRGETLPLDLGEIGNRQALPAEQQLLERHSALLVELAGLSSADRDLVKQVLDVITSGQLLDLERFGQITPGSVGALETEADLDDYTYRVAGCVGEFWTRLCREHLFPEHPVSAARLIELGVNFGKGLQLVNVLRDLPRDLKNGRCYLPRQDLAAVGLVPRDLLNPENWERLRPIHARWMERAEGYLNDGWKYTCSLPTGERRLRLACSWPVLIGLKTLEKLRPANVLDASQRVKVSRPEVRKLLLRSIYLLPFRTKWEAQVSVNK